MNILDIESKFQKDLKKPTCWQIFHQTPFITVEKDRLTAKYVGPGNQFQDAGSVRSDHPFSAQNLVDYYEITVIGDGKRSSITIGLSTEHFVTTRLPGWDTHSYGYSSGDGKKYSQGKTGKSYGPAFRHGDTIGCGISYNRKEIFFTKNGKYLGPAFLGVSLRLYPTIGLNSPGEKIQANFGTQLSSPFLFDIKTMIEEDKLNVLSNIIKTPVPVVSDINQLICSYLYHSGFTKTMEVFQKSVQSNSMKIAYESANDRKEIISLITSGKVEEGLKKMKEYMNVQTNGNTENHHHTTPFINEHILVRLHCQIIVEHIRNGSVDLALGYAQENLTNFFEGYLHDGDCNGHTNSNSDASPTSTSPTSTSPTSTTPFLLPTLTSFLEQNKISLLQLNFGSIIKIDNEQSSHNCNEYKQIRKLIDDTLALLAYINPQQSPVKYLLDIKQREHLAHDVNEAIMESLGEERLSKLEKELSQLIVCKHLLREEAGGVDSLISLTL